jgi:chaperonin GroES
MNDKPNLVKRSLIDLIEFAEEENIAELLEPHELVTIASQVKSDFEADQDSMEDWLKMTERGLEVAEPATETQDEPWEQAANFKSPTLQTEAYRFGERASTELLRPKDLVKAEVIGPSAPKALPPPPPQAPAQGMQLPEGQPPEGQPVMEAPAITEQAAPTEAEAPAQTENEKEARGDRISSYMSYQLNHEIPEWRDQQRSLLYRLPNMGTVWKKTYYDPLKEHVVSDLIQYPSFAIDQSTTSLEELSCFTHVLEMRSNDVESMQRMGLWLDIGLSFINENDDDDKSESHDSVNNFLEQQTFYDLDGDGYEEPYIVTVHQASNKVVSIVPRFTLADIMVTDGDKPVTLDSIYGEMIDELGPIDNPDGSVKKGLRVEVGRDADNKPVYKKVSAKKYEIVKIRPERNLTAYRFMPSPDGSFLGVGYYQLLSGLVEGINYLVNTLVNAGTLSTQQSGYLAKGMRAKLGNDRFKPGELKSTNIAPAELMNGILYHQFKDPSPVLFQLAQEMRGIVKEIVSSADLSEILSTNTAASTVLMMIEEAQSSTTSLMAEQARSMSKEFQIIFALNAVFTDPKHYQEVLDDPEADYEADFSSGGFDILPTANPEMASKAQRIQQGQILNDNFERLQQAGADVRAVEYRFLESLGIDNIDELLPPPSQDFMAAQTQAQQAQAKLSESQSNLMDAQAKALEANAQSMLMGAEVKQAKLPEEIEKLKSETIKNLEKAESEQAGNQIDLYTSQLKQIEGIQSLIATLGEQPNANTQSLAIRGPETSPQIPGGANLQGGI